MKGVRWIGWGLLGLVVSLLGVSSALVLPLRWIDPPTTAFMERAARELGQDAIHHSWVPLAEMSSHVPVCVLTAEDQRFPEHRGFDLESIREALAEDRERTRGASTLTQQVAKNLYLWPDRSLVRKGLEAWFTLWLELALPKARILEIHLNVAEFGRGVYGVGAASERLLGKDPADLTLEDASLLTAVLPSPRRMFVDRPSDYVMGRVTEIHYAADRWGYRYRRAFELGPTPAPGTLATASATVTSKPSGPDGEGREDGETREVDARIEWQLEPDEPAAPAVEEEGGEVELDDAPPVHREAHDQALREVAPGVRLHLAQGAKPDRRQVRASSWVARTLGA